MASDNGQILSTHLPASTPILGEPIMEGATVLAAVRCPCQQHLTVQSQWIAGQWMSTQARCPSCHTLYAVQGFTIPASGELTIHIVKGLPPPAGD